MQSPGVINENRPEGVLWNISQMCGRGGKTRCGTGLAPVIQDGSNRPQELLYLKRLSHGPQMLFLQE